MGAPNSWNSQGFFRPVMGLLLKVKVKVKLDVNFTQCSLKAQRWSRGIALLFL